MGGDKVPTLNDKTNYQDWKKRVVWWQKATDTKKENQAAKLIMHMNGKPEEVAIQLDADFMSVADGVSKLIAELDKLYEKDATQSIFAAIDSFLSYRRLSTSSMDEYIREFNQRHKNLIQRRNKGDRLFEDGILAYFLLHQANLTEEQKILIRATVKDLSYAEVETSLKRTYGEDPTRCSSACSSLTSTSSDSSRGGYSFKPVEKPVVKEEPTYYNYQHHGHDLEYDEEDYGTESELEQYYQHEDQTYQQNQEQDQEADVFYQSQRGKRPYFRPQGGQQRQRPYFRPRFPSNNQQNRHFRPNVYAHARGAQSSNFDRSPLCYLCNKQGHKARDCQFNSYKGSHDQSKKDQFGSRNRVNFFESEFALDDNDESLLYLMGETVNKALLDTGASSTVCGDKWFSVFKESLTPEERSLIETYPCEKTFRFGDGDSVLSDQKKRIPITMCGKEITLDVFVVKNDIPLLLSRETMKKMKMTIDNEHDKIYALGGESDLIITKTGHMVIPIARVAEKSNMQLDQSKDLQQLTYLVDVKDSNRCAEHLHKYFAHGSTKKIGQFIKTMELENEGEILEALENVQKSCDFCKRHKSREIPHRKVAIPQGNQFNDLMAMDLKKLNCDKWIVHFIDTVTRYSGAAAIESKDAEEILTKMFERWIAVFGRPKKIISDNGGEFVNESFTEMCSVMNIEFRTSPSESPWCNGTVERHNGLLANMIDGVLEDVQCNLDTAISWAVNAKNSLCNVFGFSPHQLVFGRNPEVPGILQYNTLPALNDETNCQLLSEHLNAMNAARTSFIKLENCDRLRRVMREKVHSGANIKYCSGDVVYYKRRNQKGPWLGPATVVGHIDNQVLLKQGGSLIRIHPCKIVLKTEADKDVTRPTKTITHIIQEPIRNRANVNENIPHRTYSGESDSDSELDQQSPWVTENSTQRSSVLRPSMEVNVPERLSNNEGVAEHDHEPENLSSTQTSDDVSWKQTNGVLKKNDIIRFRDDPDETWKNAVVIGRAGKATGMYKDMYNIRCDHEEDPTMINAKEHDIERIEEHAKDQNTHESDSSEDPEKILLLEEQDNIILQGTCLPDEHKVTKAKNDELNKFKEYGVYNEVKNIGQSTVSCRWVITKKGETVKARLVARGFEEMLVGNVDAPTVNSTSLWILISVCVSNKWNVESFDITSAFLQAEQIGRDVYINPPPDARKSGIIWKLNKPMYGLGDSSRKWYFTLKEHLIKVGCIMSQLDKTVFRYYENNKLGGILVTHVDDVLYAGNTKFCQIVIKSIMKTFKISRHHAGAFSYLGLNVSQDPETKEITVDQNGYAKSIKLIPISTSRKKDLEDKLNPDEITEFQSTLGKLLWLSGRTRPDLSYDTMELSTFAKDPKVKDLVTLNKTVKKIGDSESKLYFKAMNLKTDALKIVFFTDAGLGNLPNGNSSRGYTVFLANQNGNVNILSWSSNRIKRVVHSAFAAETLGATDAVSDAIYCRHLVSETLYNDARAKVIPVYGFVDNMQLFEQISSTKQSSDKRLRLDISEIQQSVQNHEIENISWVPTSEMLADCLTKRNADNSKLKSVLETGYCKIVKNLQ